MNTERLFIHVDSRVDEGPVMVHVIRCGDGGFCLRFGEFAHCYQSYMTKSEWLKLLSAMQRILAIDPGEEIAYYGDSEIDPNPKED